MHLPLVAAGQESEQTSRDPQALAILTQALATAGASALSAQDFTAAGTITYYWAGEEVKGSVLIRGKGVEDFSMDVSLPQSRRSLAISRGKGTLQDIDGATTLISHYNARNLAASTFPLARVAAAISNPSTRTSYEGAVQAEGRTAHKIRLVISDPDADPENQFEALRTIEVLIDASSLLIASVQDTIHGERDVNEHYSRELFYSDYRTVNGVLVAFAVTERFVGQKTWSLQLDSASFGVSLADSSPTFLALELF